ncbi:MAG: leucine--tRNA ligase [Simkaniaceae bacterium]|nr:leucine--tRNA ligase [Simkaniaceae bacterium]
MAKKYNHVAVEKKWQKSWDDEGLFKTEIDTSKPKYYVLDMFPYPSGAGLHVGHVTGYTATDIIARYKRQMGFNVLHPMGWDSFGLPAEQYAIRTGTHPEITTKANIDNYRRQLKSLGFSYDWSREIATTDPKYYKWTQWIFTKLYEKGLAYEAEVSVNFCPALGTVLANEEVEDGKSVEGGHPVERRPLRQWVLKITEYAQRLLDDLDELDWPEYLKRIQRNWIGRSEGIEVDFIEESTGETITCYTTAGHTMFGTTFVVLAPEHPLVMKLMSEEQKEEVLAYIQACKSKSDLERTELAKEKSGVFTGAYVTNPVNGQSVPLWIADYVLMNYGTGAVLAVPSHDDRDFAFATKFGLDIKPVMDPEIKEIEDEDPNSVREAVLNAKASWMGGGTMVNSEFINGMTKAQAKVAMADWMEEHGKGRRKINYKLRDWLFSRQRYWGEPFPVMHLADGSKRVLELDELPLTPPRLTDFKPSADGHSPLAKAKEWVECIDPKTGKKAYRETNTMPQWAGSCWYYLRFADPLNDQAAWSSEAEKYWLPVDMYVGGVEHAVLHLLYSRFWHKVLYDCGLVSTKEPFASMRNQGLVVANAYKLKKGGYISPDEADQHTADDFDEIVEKMSKSKLNGVSPDEIIEEFGADALRLYEMFMAPFDKEKFWNTDAVNGCKRFIDRFYSLVTSEKVCDEETEEALKLGHRLVKGVQADIEEMAFNTAIAKMMEFVNGMMPQGKYPKSVLKMATQVLAPFAPHIAEECWQILGGDSSVCFAPFPKFEERYCVDSTAEYVIQINGKVRGRIELAKDLNKEQLMEQAQAEPNVSKYLDDAVIIKTIYVPNKLLNYVVKK